MEHSGSGFSGTGYLDSGSGFRILTNSSGSEKVAERVSQKRIFNVNECRGEDSAPDAEEIHCEGEDPDRPGRVAGRSTVNSRDRTGRNQIFHQAPKIANPADEAQAGQRKKGEMEENMRIAVS